MQTLREFVFDRVSMGVQDFTPAVARSLGFASVNLDLIYGYAHVPWIVPHENRIDAEALPDASGRLALFTLALRSHGVRRTLGQESEQGRATVLAHGPSGLNFERLLEANGETGALGARDGAAGAQLQ